MVRRRTDAGLGCGISRSGPGGVRVAGLGGVGVVVVGHAALQHRSRVVLVENEQSVGGFASDGSDEPFGRRWLVDTVVGSSRLDARVGEDRVERGGELPGMIVLITPGAVTPSIRQRCPFGSSAVNSSLLNAWITFEALVTRCGFRPSSIDNGRMNALGRRATTLPAFDAGRAGAGVSP